MRKLYLHLGLPKSASTSIQWFFEHNRTALESEANFFLGPKAGWHPEFGSFFHPASMRFIYNIANGDVDVHAVRARDQAWMRDLIELLRSTGGPVLLTYEGFASLPVTAFLGMDEWAASENIAIVPIVVVRNPWRLLVSHRSQSARQGMPIESPPIDLFLQLERLMEYFGHRLRPLVMSEVPDSSNVLESFLDGVELKTIYNNPAFTFPSQTNQSLTEEAISAAKGLQMLYMEDVRKFSQRDFHQHHTHFLDSLKGHKAGAPAKMAEEYSRQIERFISSVFEPLGLDSAMPSDIAIYSECEMAKFEAEYVPKGILEGVRNPVP